MHSPRTPTRAGVVAVAAFLIATFGIIGSPAPARASTESTMESALRTWINNDRAAHGLRPLRHDSRLDTLAGQRASWMASHGTMSHTSYLGTVDQAYNTLGIRWYGCGEDIAATTYSWGLQAASNLYSMWKHSSGHWALLMSSQLNYMGIGVAYRSSNHTTYASITFLEGPDRTPPWKKMVSKSRSGTTIYFSWTGGDYLLQTHTSGLHNFDVEYRRDYGTWSVIRSGTTARSITLSGRAHGHYYSVRVRDRDGRGNLSSWSSTLTIWVP